MAVTLTVLREGYFDGAYWQPGDTITADEQYVEALTVAGFADDRRARMAGETLDVTARIYHTENGNVHAEGETYAVADRWLAETLRGIGFVSIVGWTPPTEPLPPPPVAADEPTPPTSYGRR